MMRLSARQKLLASTLMKQKGIKKLKDYAQTLHVSQRTLYEDLKVVEEHIRLLGYHVERKAGVGIRVEMVEELQHSICQERTIDKALEDRRLHILKILLFNESVITFEKLSEMFLVSKSSIKLDFESIRKNYLNDTTCSLYSDLNGTRLVGSEEQFQRTYVQFNEICFKNLEAILPSQEDQLNLLKDLYGTSIVNSSYAVLYQVTIKKFPLIAEYYMSRILNILIVVTYRVKQDIHMSKIKDTQEYKDLNIFAQSILSKIEELQCLSFHDQDIAYFIKNLIANRMKPQEENILPQDDILEIINTMSIALDVDLSNDEKLYKQLSQHVPAMLYRLKENIHIENPFLSQIKSEFTLIYHLTWLALSSLEDCMQVRFTEDEIGFVMLYFQLALDRVQPSKRVLIVCPLGISTSEMLSNRIMKLLPPLDICYHSSIQEVTQMDLESIDFIISTVPLNGKDVPYVVVSPLLNDEDIKNISELYNTTFVMHKEAPQPIVLQHIASFIQSDFMEVDTDFYDKNDVLTYTCQTLEREGYIDENYLASVEQREVFGSTSLTSNAAIPHGNPMYVKKTAIFIVVNKETLKWDEENVRVIILLSIAQGDMPLVKGILKELYKITASKDMVEKIFLNKRKYELLHLLGGSIYD